MGPEGPLLVPVRALALLLCADHELMTCCHYATLTVMMTASMTTLVLSNSGLVHVTSAVMHAQSAALSVTSMVVFSSVSQGHPVSVAHGQHRFSAWHKRGPLRAPKYILIGPKALLRNRAPIGAHNPKWGRAPLP